MRRFRRYRIARGLRWMALASVVAFLLVRLADLILLGPLVAVAENEARVRGIDAINRIVLESVSKNLRHGDLITYQKDSQERIVAYQVNTQQVNQVASAAAGAVRQEFQKMADEAISVPLGALSGSRLLGAAGPRIPVRLLPVGSVRIDLKQEFKGEGINQTRHRIWLQATARVQVVLPFISKQIEVATDLPITETVIVGPVPSSFFGGNVGGVSVPAGP